MGTLDGLRNTAKAIVDTFGTSVTLTSHSTLAYTVSTGVPTATTATTTVKAVVVRQSDEDPSAFAESARTGRWTDARVIVAASDLSTKPDTDDTVTIDGDIYRIIDVKTERGTDQAVVYDMSLRLSG